jgi:hypothetical protein
MHMGTMVSAELTIGHEYNEKKSTMHRVLFGRGASSLSSCRLTPFHRASKASHHGWMARVLSTFS